MARVKPTEVRSPDESDIINKTRKYAFLKSQLDYFEKEQKELRSELFTEIDSKGDLDGKGNAILYLPEEVEGFVSITKQCRVSRKKIDEEAAERIINAKNLQDKLYKTIKIVDQDALMAALYNDELTEAEVDEMFPKQVVYALVMNKQ